MRKNEINVGWTISLSQYTCDDNKPYCKPHYQQLFKIGGLYCSLFVTKINDMKLVK